MDTLTFNNRQTGDALLQESAPPMGFPSSSAAAIARGRALAADPSYPSFDICKKIAGVIISEVAKGKTDLE